MFCTVQMRVSILILSVLYFSFCSGFDILISTCGIPDRVSDMDGVLLNECTGNESSSSFGVHLSPSVLFLGVIFLLFDKKTFFLFCILSVSYLNSVEASLTNLDPSDIYVDSAKKFFPEKYEAEVTSNGILAAPEFYWYYDGPDSYEYIVYTEFGETIMILKEFDGTQSHFVYSFQNEAFSIFPTNRKILPFVGKEYVLNLEEYSKGETCYNVVRDDKSQFSYCLEDQKLSSLYEGYDTFSIDSFQFVDNGGRYSEIAEDILLASSEKNIISCVIGDECGCCTSIGNGLLEIGVNSCTFISLSGFGAVVCGALKTVLNAESGITLACKGLSYCP